MNDMSLPEYGLEAGLRFACVLNGRGGAVALALRPGDAGSAGGTADHPIAEARGSAALDDQVHAGGSVNLVDAGTGQRAGPAGEHGIIFVESVFHTG